MESAIFTRSGVRFVSRIDNRPSIHRVDAHQDAKEIRSLRYLENPGLARGSLSFDSHFSGAGKNLAGDQKGNDVSDKPIPRHRSTHQVVVMASVTMSDEVVVVLVKPHPPFPRALLFPPPHPLPRTP